MKKQRFATTVVAVTLSCMCTFSSLAGEWKQDSKGWWWEEYDGAYIYSKSAEEDQYGIEMIAGYTLDANHDGIGEIYFFDKNGYLYTNTELDFGSNGKKDIKSVNADGALLDKNGNVVTYKYDYRAVKADLGKGVLKNQLVNLLMQDLQTVDAKLGTTKENRRYTSSGCINLTGLGFDVVLENDRVSYIVGSAKDLFEDPNISVQDISRILGIHPIVSTSIVGDDYTWVLQDNPKVTLNVSPSIFEGAENRVTALNVAYHIYN